MNKIIILGVICILVGCIPFQSEKRKCIDGIVYSKYINNDYWIETTRTCVDETTINILLN